MNGLLVDSNVILDVFSDDPVWGDWSEAMLERHATARQLCISPVVYSEISIGFARIEELEEAVALAGFQMRNMPREGLFLAGKAFLKYRSSGGRKTAPLPDFYIGAHAAVEGMDLLTRDASRFQTYFPTVSVISPESG